MYKPLQFNVSLLNKIINCFKKTFEKYKKYFRYI